MLAGGSLIVSRKGSEIFEDHPKLVEPLLEKLTQMTIDYLNYQLAQGAQAVQLFESFADKLSPELMNAGRYRLNNKYLQDSLKVQTPYCLPKNAHI